MTTRLASGRLSRRRLDTYDYDQADQLDHYVIGGTRVTHTYDAAGNQSRSEHNQLFLPVTDYGWDDENRLDEIDFGFDVVVTNVYDGDGKRVRWDTFEPSTQHFLWDGENLLAEYDGELNRQALYTLEPAGYGLLISQHRDDASSFYHFDALGSTDRLTDENQGVVNRYIYEAFGPLVHADEAVLNAFQFVGRLGYYALGDIVGHYVRAMPRTTHTYDEVGSETRS